MKNKSPTFYRQAVLFSFITLALVGSFSAVYMHWNQYRCLASRLYAICLVHEIQSNSKQHLDFGGEWDAEIAIDISLKELKEKIVMNRELNEQRDKSRSHAKTGGQIVMSDKGSLTRCLK